MDGDCVRATMTSTKAFGCGVESAGPQDLHRLTRLVSAIRRYSLQRRQQACEHLASGDTAERAVPHCKDPTRLPDPRWAQRRLISLWCWLKAGVQDRHFLRAPSILAWDLATDFVAGVGLPALMKLLGHVNPEMTTRYVDVAGTYLQREFHLARSQPRHLAPQPKAPSFSPRGGLDGSWIRCCSPGPSINGDIRGSCRQCLLRNFSLHARQSAASLISPRENVKDQRGDKVILVKKLAESLHATLGSPVRSQGQHSAV
jgi:hypothetical protein